MKIKIIFIMLFGGLLFATQSIYSQCHSSKDEKSKTEHSCDKSKCGDNCLHSSSHSNKMNSDSNKTVKVNDSKRCPVSGETIEDGSGVEYTYLGTVYTFCCKNCIGKFNKEPMEYIQGELICPVGGETASKDVSTTVDGVKYYFCCQGCIGKFEADPQKYLNKDSK